MPFAVKDTLPERGRPLAAVFIARDRSFWHIHAGTGILRHRDSLECITPFGLAYAKTGSWQRHDL